MAAKKSSKASEALMGSLFSEMGSPSLSLVSGGLYATLRQTKVYAVIVRSSGMQNNGKSETRWFRFLELASTPIWKLGKSVRVETQVCEYSAGSVFVYAGVNRAEVNVKDETHRPLVHTFVCASSGITVAYPRVDLSKLLVQVA